MTEPIRKPLIRIMSDGTPHRTKITHVETGADLTNTIRSIKWEMLGGEVATVTVEYIGSEVQSDIRGAEEITMKEAEARALDPQQFYGAGAGNMRLEMNRAASKIEQGIHEVSAELFKQYKPGEGE